MPAKIIGDGPNPSGLCQCGCGQPTTIAKRSDSSTGNVGGTPYRYLRGHWNRKGPDFLVDENGCWVWQQYVGPGGYGLGRFGGDRKVAHRGIYEQAKGDIPDGAHLDHLCKNRACVNPDHLEVVTPIENARRGVSTKLTADDIRAIRVSTEPRCVIADRYGVGERYVTKIQQRLAWRDIDAQRCECCGGTGWISDQQEAA